MKEMKMLNKVQLIGRIGKNPEVRKCQNGTSMMMFSVATQSSYKDKDGKFQTSTTWHDIKYFNASEYAINNLCKGSLVYVEGRIAVGSYTNSQAQIIKTFGIEANIVYLLDKKDTKSTDTAIKATVRDLPNDDIPF